MLGNSTIKNYFNSTSVADVKPRAVVEWNANVVSNPYIYGTSNKVLESESLNLRNFISLKSSPAPSIVSRGKPSALFSDTNCQLMISGNSSLSTVVTHKQSASGIVTLTTQTEHKITPGAEIFVDRLGENYNGSFIAISGTANSTIRYDTSNPSLNVSKMEAKPKGVVASYVNSYYIDKSVSSNHGVKFFMKLKSDYSFQSISDPDFIEEFDVTLKAIGMLENQYVFTQVITKNFTVNASQWTNASISLANPDSPVDKIRLILEFDSPLNKKTALLVDELLSIEVSDYEVYVDNRLPVQSVFNGWRPGEPIIDYPSRIPKIQINDSEIFPQQCTPLHMASQYAIGSKYETVQRSVTPFTGNPYNYYVSGSKNSSKIVWAMYENIFQTNKIVIKVNAIAAKPSEFTIKLLINNSWQNIEINDPVEFNENGILSLYYDGQSWSDTAWTMNFVPKINEANGSINKKINIKGIYFECDSLEYIDPLSPLNGKGTYAAINILELIEISPRLELDLSDYLVDVSIEKELSNTSQIPLPVGSVSSNSANITFSSIMITSSDPDGLDPTENNDISLFSNYSENSPLKGLIIGGAKIKGSFDVDINNSGLGANYQKTNIPAFYMYVDTWSDSSLSNNSVSVAECFDSIKDLQNTSTRPIYLVDKTLNEVIQSVLDPIGFGDYSFEELKNLKTIIRRSSNAKVSIPHFWTDKNSSVSDTLNEIFKPYQIGMFIDEYGYARFTSLIKMNQDRLAYINGDTSDLLRVQDFKDVNSNSNIVSMNVNEDTPIKKISINYKTPRPHISDPSLTKKFENGVIVRNAPDVVWEPDGETEILPYFELAAPGIVNETQDRIPYNPRVEMKSFVRAIDYSGYLLIDDEIIKYGSKEFAFTVNNSSSYIRVENIKNKSDINRIVSEIVSERNTASVTYAPTGFLTEVERGQFGTVPGKHRVLSSGREFDWSAKDFNSKFDSVSNLSKNAGRYYSSNGNIAIKCDQSGGGGMFLYPDEKNTVLGKRKFFCRYAIQDVPQNQSGYMGAAIGVKIINNKITDGLFILTGVKAGKKKEKIDLVIKQVYTSGGETKIQDIVSREDLDFDGTSLFQEDDLLELYVEFNGDMNRMKIFLGSTSIFSRSKKPKKGNKESTPPIPIFTEIKSIKKDGLFGFAATGNISGTLDDLAFTRKSDPKDLNTIMINNNESDYQGDKDGKTGSGFYIGPSTLLSQLAHDQFIPGVNHLSSGFVFTGAPVARGIKIYEVDYELFPVISQPKIIFPGYSYEEVTANTSYILGGQ